MAVTLVEEVSGANAGKATTLDLVLTSAPTSGNLLVVMLNHDGTGTPTLNNGTWNSIDSNINYVSGRWFYWWWKIAGGLESATTTLSSVSQACGALLEFNSDDGWDTIGTKAATNTGTSTSPSANSVGGNSNELLHVALFAQNSNKTPSSPTNSYTLGTLASRGSTVGIVSSYRIFTTETATGTGLSWSASCDWGTAHAPFLVDVASDVPVSLVFDGTAGIQLTTQVDVPVTLTLDGSGDVVLSTQVDLPTSLTLDGTGDVVLSFQVDVQASPVFDGTGDIQLATQVDVPVSLAIDGSGDVQLTTQVGTDQDGAHAYDGVGDVVLAYQVDLPVSLTLDGSGDLALATQVDLPVSLTFDGVGDVVLATSVSGAGGQEILTIRTMGY